MFGCLQMVSEMLDTISEELSEAMGEPDAGCLPNADSFPEAQSSPSSSFGLSPHHDCCIQVCPSEGDPAVTCELGNPTP